mgnify:CR=1 FL=1
MNILLKKNYSLMLDLGANVEGDAENLVQFGMLGAALRGRFLVLSSPLLDCSTLELKK